MVASQNSKGTQGIKHAAVCHGKALLFSKLASRHLQLDMNIKDFPETEQREDSIYGSLD